MIVFKLSYNFLNKYLSFISSLINILRTLIFKTQKKLFLDKYFLFNYLFFFFFYLTSLIYKFFIINFDRLKYIFYSLCCYLNLENKRQK